MIIFNLMTNQLQDSVEMNCSSLFFFHSHPSRTCECTLLVGFKLKTAVRNA